VRTCEDRFAQIDSGFCVLPIASKYLTRAVALEDALLAARARPRLRYERLVRAAAEGISNKNRETLKRMMADE